MGAILSKRQQKAARNAATRHLDTHAVVKRNVSAPTRTGTSTTLVVVYDQIPCHVNATTDSTPTVTTQEDATNVLDQRAYAWFPLQWPDARTVVPPGEDPVPVDVVILRGDVIEANGHSWRATTDQDPDSGDPTRRRVPVDRPHGLVSA